MKLSSDAFGNGGTIPDKYAKKGGNCSPHLLFDDVPAKARSLLLVMDDPDAPRGLFTHWVVFNIGPAMKELPEGGMPEGVRQGRNSWGEPSYGGPQPPDREHRYFFRLYALDVLLGLADGATRQEVGNAMRGHIIAQAEWMGRFAPHAIAAH